jgi:hypothetical protein
VVGLFILILKQLRLLPQLSGGMGFVSLIPSAQRQKRKLAPAPNACPFIGNRPERVNTRTGPLSVDQSGVPMPPPASVRDADLSDKCLFVSTLANSQYGVTGADAPTVG